MLILWLGIMLAVPVWLHWRGTGAAGLSLGVAAIYGLIAAGVWLVTILPPDAAQMVLRTVTLADQDADGSYHDTYYVVANGMVLFTPALLFGGIGFILWVLTRWDALRHQRIAKTLFWVLHLSVLGLPLVDAIFVRRGMPRRFIDYEEAMALPIAIQSTLAGVAAATFLTIVALMLWSAIARLRR